MKNKCSTVTTKLSGSYVYHSKVIRKSEEGYFIESKPARGCQFVSLNLGMINKDDIIDNNIARSLIVAKAGCVPMDDIEEALGKEKFDKLLKFLCEKYDLIEKDNEDAA